MQQYPYFWSHSSTTLDCALSWFDWFRERKIPSGKPWSRWATNDPTGKGTKKRSAGRWSLAINGNIKINFWLYCFFLDKGYFLF